MLTLIFTNTVLSAYMTYIIVEKKWDCLKNTTFWAIAFLLFISICITISVCLPEQVKMVKEQVFFP